MSLPIQYLPGCLSSSLKSSLPMKYGLEVGGRQNGALYLAWDTVGAFYEEPRPHTGSMLSKHARHLVCESHLLCRIRRVVGYR